MVYISWESYLIRCQLLQFWEIFTFRSTDGCQFESKFCAFFRCVCEYKSLFPEIWWHKGWLSVPDRGLTSEFEDSPSEAAVPNFFGTRDRFVEDNFSTDGSGAGDGSGGNASDGERQMNLRLLAHPPLTSCCLAWFLTGCRPVLVCGPGVGHPCSGGFISKIPKYPGCKCEA